MGTMRNDTRTVDQTKRGLLALLLAWPALLFVRVGALFESFAPKGLRPAGQDHRGLLKQSALPAAVRIERYSFTLNAPVRLGDPCPLAVEGSTNVSIATDKLLVNAPCPGFFLLEEVSIDGVNVLVGEVTDAFAYSPMAMGDRMVLPPITTKSRVVVRGRYTGLVPPGYVGGLSFLACVTFMGGVWTREARPVSFLSETGPIPTVDETGAA